MRYLLTALLGFTFFIVTAAFILRAIMGDMLGDFEWDSDEE